MEALINQTALTNFIQEQVHEAVKKIKPLPRTEKFTPQVRQDLFHGKGDEWVRTFIFDKYPETDEKNGGWVINPRKTPHGKSTSIWVRPAIKWLDDHEHEIDWNAKLPQ